MIRLGADVLDGRWQQVTQNDLRSISFQQQKQQDADADYRRE